MLEKQDFEQILEFYFSSRNWQRFDRIIDEILELGCEGVKTLCFWCDSLVLRGQYDKAQKVAEDGASRFIVNYLQSRQETLTSVLCSSPIVADELQSYLVDKVFKFARFDSSFIAHVKLCSDGKITPSPSQNEVTWAIKEDKLTFMNAAGKVTTQFKIFQQPDSKKLLGIGEFVFLPVIHVLEELDCSFINFISSFSKHTYLFSKPESFYQEYKSYIGEVDSTNYQKFCILGSPHSGSNLLLNYLNALGDVYCDDELYKFEKVLTFAGSYDHPALIFLRKYYPKEFLELMLSRKVRFDGRKITQKIRGFRLSPSQEIDICRYIFSDDDFKIVLIKRDNLLAQYSSYEFAILNQKESDIDAVTSDSVKRANSKLVFSSQRFDEYCMRSNEFYATLEKEISKISDRCFVIEYKQIFEQDTAKLLSFLEVDTSLLNQDAFLSQKKQKSQYLPDRFLNPDEVISYAAKQELEHWLSD